MIIDKIIRLFIIKKNQGVPPVPHRTFHADTGVALSVPSPLPVPHILGLCGTGMRAFHFHRSRNTRI